MHRATLTAVVQCNFSKLASIIRKLFINLVLHNYAKNEEDNVRSCSYNVSTRKTRIQGSDDNPECENCHKTGSFMRPMPMGYHEINHAWKPYWRLGNTAY